MSNMYLNSQNNLFHLHYDSCITYDKNDKKYITFFTVFDYGTLHHIFMFI